MHTVDTSINDNVKFKRKVNDDLVFPRIWV